MLFLFLLLLIFMLVLIVLFVYGQTRVRGPPRTGFGKTEFEARPSSRSAQFEGVFLRLLIPAGVFLRLLIPAGVFLNESSE